MAASARCEWANRRQLRRAIVASIGLLVAVGVQGGAVAHSVSRVGSATSSGLKVRGFALQVLAVPHSSDVWLIVQPGSAPHAKFYLEHRHHGHWTKVKSPKLGGYGHLDAMAAVSPKVVFLTGGVTCNGLQQCPTVWRLKGKKFVKMKLPPLDNGAAGLYQISASSPTDVWASSGDYSLSHPGQAMLHYDGKKWSEVPFPFDGNNLQDGVSSISASSRTNAWATHEGQLVHWDGHTWTTDPNVPAGLAPVQVTTTSSKRAYALVQISSTATPPQKSTVILRLNGDNWVRMKLSKKAQHTPVVRMAMIGKQAWAIGGRLHGRAFNAVAIHTNGGTWKPQKVLGAKGEGPSYISAGSAKSVYSSGQYFNAKTNAVHGFVMTVHGHSWRTIS